MKLNDYSAQAKVTAVYTNPLYPYLGLGGEVGEVLEKRKKILRDNDGQVTPEQAQMLALELGDVLWYLNACAMDLGFTLEQVAQMNIDKLMSRRERGKIHGSGDLR